MLTAVLMVPAPAAAQGGTCELVSVGGYTYRTRFDSASFVHHGSGGIDYRCTDGMRLLADSAVVFESNEQVHLFGRVRLEDADTELDADSAQYFGGLKQLHAWSNVTVRDRRSGAVISGHRLLYDRATEVRALDRMQVYGGDPHAVVHPVARVETLPVDSAAAGDSAAVADSAAAGDSAAVADSAAAGDSAAVADSAALDEGAVPEDPLSPEVVEEVAAGQDSLAVEDTLTLPPYEIDAERFILEGRRYFRAAVDVVVARDSLLAFGDSLDYDQEVGSMSIIGDARVEGQGYLLTASTVSVTPLPGLSEELLARGRARLSGREVDMTAPAIRMFLNAGRADRIVAIGEVPPLPEDPLAVDVEGLSPGDARRVLARRADAAARETDSAAVADSLYRPSVEAGQFNLSGDSIDVLSPGQVLDLVTAVGAARAEGQPDDTVAARGLPEVARRDWMEGDTIYARFVSPGSADSIAAPGSADAAPGSDDASPVPPPGGHSSRLETMTAVGGARSLYRLVDSDTAQAGPGGARAGADTVQAVSDTIGAAPDTTRAGQPGSVALHWVEGQKIIVYLEGRQVAKMDVEGQITGYHLEPLPLGTPPDSAADSAAVKADSAAVRPDTVRLRVPVTSTLRADRNPTAGRKGRK